MIIPRVFYPKLVAKRLSYLVVASFAACGLTMPMALTMALAQETSQPLDLTVLSTSEENVQFIVEEGDEKLLTQTRQDEGQRQLLQGDNLSIETQASDETQDTRQEQQGEAVAIDTAQELTAEEPKTTGRMTRRTIKDVGLASIGIGRGQEQALDNLDNRLWRGLSLETSLRLIESVPVPLSSDSLSKMSYHVIARQAVPPKGAAENPVALLSARMSYLSRIGRSSGLASITEQLPQSDEWQAWQMWKLFYDLMSRNDEKACAIAAEESTTSLDGLWQKLNLMCQILTGDETRAAFSADVLKASGLIDDPLYFELIDVLLRRKTAEDISQFVATSQDAAANDYDDFMHIILMDAARIGISAERLSRLDNSYAEAANRLRYLNDDARHTLGMTNLRAGLISRDQAKALFIASPNSGETPLIAMTRRLEASAQDSDSASVTLFLSLREAVQQSQEMSQDEAQELVESLITAIALEVKDGQGAIFVPLYAPYLSQVMAQLDMTALPSELQKNYVLTLAIAGLPLSPLPTDGSAVVLADYVQILFDETSDTADLVQSLERLSLTDLLPLIDTSQSGAQEWFELFAQTNAQTEPIIKTSYQSLSASGLLALDEAAGQRQRAQAVIIAAMLTGATPLHEISPSDHAQIISLLAKAGLPNTAQAYRTEALMAHVTSALLAPLAGET